MPWNWFRRFAVVEVFIIGALTYVLVMLLLPVPMPPPPLTDKDFDFTDWRPGPGELTEPSPSLLVLDSRIAGKWQDPVHWTTFTIDSAPNGNLRVKFRSSARCAFSGCIQLERLARYDRGVLELNRPVRELNGTTYQRLFTVRLANKTYLVPSPRVAEVEQAGDVEIPIWGVMARHADG